MSQNKPLTHTDNSTKGGQIFSHIWRMKLQTFNLLFIIFFLTFAFVWSYLVVMNGVSWWEIFDVYLCGYLVGHLKLIFWEPFKTLFVLPMNEVSMGIDGLLHKPVKPLSSIYVENKDLLTSLYVPKWGGRYVWQTLSFLKQPWVKSISHPINMYVYWSAASGASAMFAMLSYFIRRGARTQNPHILEGQEQVSQEVLAQIIGENKSDLMLSPKLPFVKGTHTEHTLLVGSTGQGKTNRMMDILGQLRAQGKKVVVLDITGEFTSTFFRQGKDILLNPLDARSHTWDVWSEKLLLHEYDAWAASMIPENGRDPVWHETARKLLATTALRLQDSQDKSMKKILEWSCWVPLGRDTERFYANSPVSGIMLQNSEKTTIGVRMSLSNSISALEHLEASDTPLSITEWMKETNDEWLFLTALPSQRNTLAPLLASWFNFSFLGLERCGPQKDREIWFVIDELPGLRYRIDALPRMVAEGRKYGACCLFGFQNKAQLDHLFGMHDAKAILSNCSTKVIYRTPETQTADYISNTLGRVEIQESSENISLGSHQMRDGVNLNQSRRVKPVVSATDIMNLERFEAFVSLPGDLPIAKVTFPLVKTQTICEAFVAKEPSKEKSTNEVFEVDTPKVENVTHFKKTA